MSDKAVNKYKDNYQKFPKLTKMRKLWHLNYWDGPLSGMCLIDGQKYWFDCIEQYHDNNPQMTDEEFYAGNEYPWYRKFLIWKLTDDQQAVIEARHAKFQRMVGTHTDYDENGQRSNFHYNDTVTPETLKQFYEESKLEKPFSIEPFSDAYILGWYEWV